MSFLFLLFFPSSKSLIYKITQKINVLPYKIIRIKRTHQYCKNTIKGICKARVIVATRQKREIIILNIKNILLFFNILHQSFQKKPIYLFFICPYFSFAISTCHNHICVETIGSYLSDVVDVYKRQALPSTSFKLPLKSSAAPSACLETFSTFSSCFW